MKKKIRVLIIDDSALIRKLLTEILESDPDIKVIDTATDPYVARDKIKRLKPDVLTLDIEMPKMDGITFLRNLMRLHPMPVVMVSTLTNKGADVTLESLALGAVDYVSKPKSDVSHSLQDYTEEIIEKVKVAANANIHALVHTSPVKVDPKLSADAVLDKTTTRSYRTTDKVIAIGASTGGTEAIKNVLVNLPADSPGIVISQHIPESFSASFAERMDRLSILNVHEARDGQAIMSGNVYIAPGNKHLIVKRDGARYVCHLNDGSPVNRHKPSVDVMFRSVAQSAGPNAIGIILTGMGDDGARGMQEMHEAGAITIAQDQNTSVVWGMPGEAVKLGCIDNILPLQNIAGKIITLSKE
ncbi:MAG: chemotaxis response regulator protein-glutamate methylesterase [Gammaproteobacteria bacterium]|nr:chemotaxis response regulator protein-glutamate methylesterase [Gammaproteobacteria bacterium]